MEHPGTPKPRQGLPQPEFLAVYFFFLLFFLSLSLYILFLLSDIIYLAFSFFPFSLNLTTLLFFI